MKKCCICGKEFDGWGNNPWPVKDNGECCDECNFEYVIAARLIMVSSGRKPTIEEIEKWNKGE